jgi:hypothetical protein
METEVRKLEQILDWIWRAGDRDECSIKHIGHALAALIAHNDWTKGDDYSLPNDYWTGDEATDKKLREELLGRIMGNWAEIQKMKDELGLTKFVEIVKSSKFGFYPIEYLDDEWLSYKAQYDKLVSV